ncbi:MAG: 50S ribosomal protein L6 [Deltaproteobacteria bacterium]|nr:50S ribosomal protein L6 [Deltaproteobacteria bacterium]MDD9854506.1 50S ribosomal protein L6 [Deltaproteobacteria bacterium]
MSRIGRKPVVIPQGVEVAPGGEFVEVRGPRGALRERLPRRITCEVAEGQVRLARPDDRKESKALHGLARALVQNMVTGVTEGFAKELEISGVGYRAESRGGSLRLLIGFSHPVEMQIPEGIEVSVQENTRILVRGSSRQLVGQFAANLRKLRPPEPYKGKGIRYADEQIRRKAGKTAVG